MRLPSSIKVVGLGAFSNCEQLRYAELNEGLETLGEKWNNGKEEHEGTVFAGSGIERIKISSTLKVIQAYTFFKCKSLKTVEFSEGLEKIGVAAFRESGIENIVLPVSTKAVGPQAFEGCEQLRSVRLNEGLKTLGAKEQCGGKLF